MPRPISSRDSWKRQMAGNMRFLRRNYKALIRCSQHGRYCTASRLPTQVDSDGDNDYTATPEYPPVERIDPEYLETKKQKEWYDKIKRQITVEEKLLELNVPRYWGWKCFMVLEGVIPFNNLVFSQHITRTHLVETETLPDYYARFSEKSGVLAKGIRNDVIDAIEYQLSVRHRKLSELKDPLDKEKELTKIIVAELNRVIMNRIWSDEKHLKTMQIDYSPRIEAGWKVESLVETPVREENKHGIPLDELPEEYLDRPSDKYIQYTGTPILQLRHSDPLPELMDPEEARAFSDSVPVYEYDPHITLGYEMARRHVTNIPGFWPGDDREFSFLSYHLSNHAKHRPPSYGSVDTKETLQSQAVFASFGWLMALACYQGFSTYHDVTYPTVTQTVLTDGREFTFAAYQLNTTELYHRDASENPKCNVCWSTPTEPLYERCEEGKLKGFNEGVLERLLRFYLNVPSARADSQSKPYLGDSVQRVADYEDEEKRVWLEKKVKRISGNKCYGREDFMYEVQDWERIYKIKFARRPADPRARPFELRLNPYHTKMSDVKGMYIPKKLRPDKHLPKWKQRKFQRTYYPE